MQLLLHASAHVDQNQNPVALKLFHGRKHKRTISDTGMKAFRLEREGLVGIVSQDIDRRRRRAFLSDGGLQYYQEKKPEGASHTDQAFKLIVTFVSEPSSEMQPQEFSLVSTLLPR